MKCKFMPPNIIFVMQNDGGATGVMCVTGIICEHPRSINIIFDTKIKVHITKCHVCYVKQVLRLPHKTTAAPQMSQVSRAADPSNPIP